MASHNASRRRQVKVPERFSPGPAVPPAAVVRDEWEDDAPSAAQRKRGRAASSGHDDLLERLLEQNERHHAEWRTEMTAMREELGRQTRQLARCIRGLADIQDVLLDIHESTAKEQDRKPIPAAKEAKRAAVEEVVVSLQSSADPAIPAAAAAAAAAQAPDSPFPSGYPTGCVPPAIWERLETIAK